MARRRIIRRNSAAQVWAARAAQCRRTGCNCDGNPILHGQFSERYALGDLAQRLELAGEEWDRKMGLYLEAEAAVRPAYEAAKAARDRFFALEAELEAQQRRLEPL